MGEGANGANYIFPEVEGRGSQMSCEGVATFTMTSRHPKQAIFF